MNGISRTLSQALGVATLATAATGISALASTQPPTFVDPAQLSVDEKTTLTQVFLWRKCLGDRRRETNAQAALLAAERAAAADDVTRRKLAQWGWTQEDIEKMVTLLRSSEENRFSMIFSNKDSPETECFKRLKLDQETLVPALTLIREKYGPDIDGDKGRDLVLPSLKP